MNGIAHIPLVRLFIPFLSGILFVVFGGISNHLQELLLIFIFLAIIVFINNKVLNQYNNRWLFGVLISIFFFFAGISITINYNEKNNHNHFSKYENKEDAYTILQIIEPVSERRNSFRLVCEAKNIINDTIALNVSGKIMLYVEKDSIASSLNYGDKIITNNIFTKIQAPKNPNQFNYKRFLAFNNIYYQGYRSSGHYFVISENNGSIVLSHALSLRERAMSTLKKHSIKDREFAVLSALLLGYRDYIDDRLRQQFASAGAMHILCVSGLHVGIIYIILNHIFSFFNRLKNGVIPKTIIIIILIWFYATLTGFSPSVLRASTMFSFVAVAKSFNRYTNIYNILAASAFVLTIFNPYIVTKIGFQLSYLAVIGIVSMQPHLYKIFYIKNKILDKAWAITTVSIAAQLATGPLALYYFGIFPNYFILTNLVVIPLSSLIIYTALIFLIFSPITFLAKYIGHILSLLVFCMHKSVSLIEKIPYSSMQNISIDFFTTFLVVFLIITVSYFFIKKNKTALKLSMISIIILSVSFSSKSIRHHKQKLFIVYSINNRVGMDFIHRNTSNFIACNELYNNGERDISFNISQNRNAKKIENINSITIGSPASKPNNNFWTKDNYIYFEGLKIKILTDFNRIKKNKEKQIKPINLDYLIISKNPWLNIKDIKKYYNFDKLIIDSSNPLWKVNKWIEECKKIDIEYWSTRHDGAYIKNI